LPDLASSLLPNKLGNYYVNFINVFSKICQSTVRIVEGDLMSQPKVGIPRGLLYYNYFPLWQTFFESLGAEVVVSSETNRQILRQGTEVAENEFCLPVKVFYGHVLNLKDKVDSLFIPRVVSVEKRAYTCPKLLGLPDMVQAIDNSLPPVLSPTINLLQGRKKFYRTVFELGRSFTQSSLKIVRAYRRAAKEYRSFQKKLETGLTPPEAMVASPLKRENFQAADEQLLKIGIVGHNYNIYDSFITMSLVEKLEKLGVKVVTAESLPRRAVEKEAATLPKKLFWTFEKEIIGAAFHWLRRRTVDGIIYVLAFACGPDSLIQTLLEHEAKKLAGIPLLSIVIDEHTGEAGLVTRLEAFVDMLKRKGVTSEDSFSSYGESLHPLKRPV